MLVLLGGLGAARIDHDHAPSAIDDRVELLADARSRQHRAVRDERVRADHQQEAGPLQVRDREQQRRAVEERRGREAVVHVLRARGVIVRRAEPVEEALHPEGVAVAEGARVAHVPGDAVRSARVEHALEAAGDVRHRLLPRGALELARAAGALERVEDAVRVVLDPGHRDSLRARITAGERVFGVRAQLRQAAVLDRRDHPAEGFADPAEGDAFLDRHPSVRVYRHRVCRKCDGGTLRWGRDGPICPEIPVKAAPGGRVQACSHRGSTSPSLI
jgi:hypothetical protein